MTLCVGWIRKINETEEICLAADSCFSGNQRFYAAPKIFPLSRGDCAIACAGSTTYSLPIVEHIMRAIEINGPVNDRAYDFLRIIHLIEDIANKCLFEEQWVQEDEVEGPDFTMIIAGYSWLTKSARLFVLKYDTRLKKMKASKTSTMMKTPFAVIGDKDKIEPFKRKVHKALEADGVIPGGMIGFQPLEVLIDYINDSNITTIAGHPQMVKVYSYMQTLPIGFYYPSSGDIYYFGRPLLGYETFPYPIYDMDTKQFKYMKLKSDEFKRFHEETKPLGKKFKGIK